MLKEIIMNKSNTFLSYQDKVNLNYSVPDPHRSYPSIYPSVKTIIQENNPTIPVHIFRYTQIKEAGELFLKNFPGDILYAVKANTEEHILRKIIKLGIHHFDVASINEVEIVRRLSPTGNLYYMNTVKSKESIHRAYYDYNVRHFSLDSFEEIEKIKSATNSAKDLVLYVRLSIPSQSAQVNFGEISEKFGVEFKDAIPLLRAMKEASKETGICFHVGSQCRDPDDFRKALQETKRLIVESGVSVDHIDVGGGFPALYEGAEPLPVNTFIDAIRQELDQLGLRGLHIMCEPGRALVAGCMSLLVKVELRKGNFLYINDGIYGCLFEAFYGSFRYPTQCYRSNGDHSRELIPFSLYGPTCDSSDYIKGPFHFPKDIRIDDYIEFGQVGAYGSMMKNDFNGFYNHLSACVSEPF